MHEKKPGDQNIGEAKKWRWFVLKEALITNYDLIPRTGILSTA
jgi:hypothetical protein